METFKNMLSPLGMNTGAIQDTLKLVVIGGTVETARRASISAWNGFVDSFFLTAHFSQEDYPYDWLMHWLSKQPAWGRSREFEITTRTVSRNGLTQSTTGDLEDDDEEEEDEDALVHGRRKRKVAFMPSLDTTHTIYYRGHWLRITRTKRYPDYGHGSSLKISVVARNNDILKKLVLEAKREYEKDAEHRVHIFMADTTYGCWRWNGARQKRPMSSIVLQPGVKDMLLADCKDFLCSEDWYAERGIPFRRGYLLYGVPGSGKTSLIHSLAGELGLDIYVVSLSSKGMSDNTLTTLMGHVPSRCILLLEDLDAAFTRSVSRDSSSTGAPTPSPSTPNSNDANDGSTLSLSGLLNSLDGVAAAEGRLLFATTNHIERLDPALSRPGRMDVWVNFTHATKWQAEGIFKCFFPSKPVASPSSTSQEKIDVSQKNLPLPKRRPGHAIPVLEEAEIAELAKRFADAIPEGELSVAALQGYLLKNKVRPRECVDEVGDWIIQERETREKLKKEKAEREAKEKKELAEEKERKEKEEKAAKEQDERETREKLEKRDRAKSKKAHRAETVMKLEGATAAPASSTPADAVIPVVHSESASSSESDTSNGGIEADTEESMTSEEEPDKPAGATSDAKEQQQTTAKDKWIAVKGHQPPPPPPSSSSSPLDS
ncbi:P-loop containing nucleoside triphosphate hydrolase protein [Chiua virens]|nr:P-loop containing nucleoside triphosphate hydrolase protein [Chiua virens]